SRKHSMRVNWDVTDMTLRACADSAACVTRMPALKLLLAQCSTNFFITEMPMEPFSGQNSTQMVPHSGAGSGLDGVGGGVNFLIMASEGRAENCILARLGGRKRRITGQRRRDGEFQA